MPSWRKVEGDWLIRTIGCIFQRGSHWHPRSYLFQAHTTCACPPWHGKTTGLGQEPRGCTRQKAPERTLGVPAEPGPRHRLLSACVHAALQWMCSSSPQSRAQKGVGPAWVTSPSFAITFYKEILTSKDGSWEIGKGKRHVFSGSSVTDTWTPFWQFSESTDLWGTDCHLPGWGRLRPAGLSKGKVVWDFHADLSKSM